MMTKEIDYIGILKDNNIPNDFTEPRWVVHHPSSFR